MLLTIETKKIAKKRPGMGHLKKTSEYYVIICTHISVLKSVWLILNAKKVAQLWEYESAASETPFQERPNVIDQTTKFA